MNRLTASARATIALIVAAFLAPNAGSAQQQVSVVVNGQTMSFDQPPVERAGRVFVPLRGVFERLGASVVYQNGQINATGNGRNISLSIGSTQATVDGQPQTLDVAPFLIGARTLVPLRFVAQALGASVNWDQSTSSVIIGSSGGGPGGAGPGGGVPPNPSFRLSSREPSGTVNTLQPAIHANFSEPVRGRSLRVSLDGNDVTQSVYSNPNGFDLAPPSALAVGRHRVSVSGVTQAGASFDTGWAFFTSGAAGTNFIRDVMPAPNARVPQTFRFTGVTAPNARVHLIASGAQSVMLGFEVGTSTYQTDVQADGAGRFSAQIALGARVAQVRVIVKSVASDGTAVVRQYQYTM